VTRQVLLDKVVEFKLQPVAALTDTNVSLQHLDCLRAINTIC